MKAPRREPLAWPEMMRLGLGALRLPPEAFWSMTPVELLCALEGAGLRAAPTGSMPRARLEALMAAHPDRSSGRSSSDRPGDRE